MIIGHNVSFLKYLLILIRCSGFFILTPIYNRREFPAIGRIVLAALLSLIIYPLIQDPYLTQSMMMILIHVLRELVVGMIMGYVVFLIFSALYLAGELIDLEMGFGMVNVMDPQSNTQVPLMGNFYYVLTTLFFLTLNGHHVLITAMVKSFEIVPLGQATYQSGLSDLIIMNFIEVFIIGVEMALPIISIIFLADLALGIIARTVPQMNVFIVGLPVKIAVGILGMILTFPMYIIAFELIYNKAYEDIFMILKQMWIAP